MNAGKNITINGNIQVYLLPASTFELSDVLGEITNAKPNITYNTSRIGKNGTRLPDGIEIRFGAARPTEETRKILKEHGYKFSEKQVMWYAKDTPLSRRLADTWENTEVEIDTTQYVKHHFWAPVKNIQEYAALRSKTEFFVTDPQSNYYSKSAIEKAHDVAYLIRSGLLKFKKYFNRAADETALVDPNNSPSGAGSPKPSQDHAISPLNKLELEAEAELELLRMRVEMERRKSRDNFNGLDFHAPRLTHLRIKAKSLNNPTILDFK